MSNIDEVQAELLAEVESSENYSSVLKSPKLKQLYGQVGSMPPDERAEFGKRLNGIKQAVEAAITSRREAELSADLAPIDVTAPWGVNAGPAALLPTGQGSIHPLTQEIDLIADIFARMGFVTEESRELDDQFHMFESLNFPKDHPARDEYDTFATKEKDQNGDSFVAPAHTSTMQNRLMKKYRQNLENSEPIAVIVPDRVFRNEDVDARHEHTFYQIEGVYIDKDVNVGNLIATLQTFLEEYYGKKLDVRVNPFYFPFTEPSFEFALSCPFCEGKDAKCKVCSGEGWIELLGCGLIHPNVMKYAGIDPTIFTGFAFGCGIDRLVMMKQGVEDVRHFHSAKLDFLRQF